MTAFPSGWSSAPLGQVAEIRGGIQKQPKRAPQTNSYPFLRVANVTSTGLDLGEIHKVELFEGELERYRLRLGDLLVVEGNGSPSQIGRAALWDGSVQDVVHQNHLIRVRPGPRLEARFLAYFWNSPTLREKLRTISSSTSGLHTLSVSKLQGLAIPLPPLSLQQRIVDLLEDHLSRLDAAEVLLVKAVRRQSGLEASWLASQPDVADAQQMPLGSLLASPLRHGRSVPTADQGFPVLRLTALNGPRVDLSERKVGAWAAQEAAAFLVSRGDFLVARGSGSLHLVGRGSLVHVEPDPVAYPDTAIRVRGSADQITPEFLALVWNSRPVRAQIEAVAKTTAGIHKVNQADLGRVSVPLPSLEQQRDLVLRAEGFLTATRRLDLALAAARLRAGALRRSLLAAAFTGQLINAPAVSEGLHV